MLNYFQFRAPKDIHLCYRIQQITSFLLYFLFCFFEEHKFRIHEYINAYSTQVKCFHLYTIAYLYNSLQFVLLFFFLFIWFSISDYFIFVILFYCCRCSRRCRRQHCRWETVRNKINIRFFNSPLTQVQFFFARSSVVGWFGFSSSYHFVLWYFFSFRFWLWQFAHTCAMNTYVPGWAHRFQLSLLLPSERCLTHW